MPTLGSYVGQLLAEITNARLQADLESVRIAQLYASHPLLKNMPVPRFRLPTVSLELPVAISNAGGQDPKSHIEVNPKTVKKNAVRLIEDTLKQNLDIGATPASVTKAVNEIFSAFAATESEDPTALGLASDQAVSVVISAIKAALLETKKDLPPQTETELSQKLALEFHSLLPRLPSVQIIAVTGQLRELGPSQNLTRVQLTITEEGVEWKQINPSDASTMKLIPE